MVKVLFWFKQSLFIHRNHKFSRQQVKKTQKQYVFKCKCYLIVILKIQQRTHLLWQNGISHYCQNNSKETKETKNHHNKTGGKQRVNN